MLTALAIPGDQSIAKQKYQPIPEAKRWLAKFHEWVFNCKAIAANRMKEVIISLGGQLKNP